MSFRISRWVLAASLFAFAPSMMTMPVVANEPAHFEPTHKQVRAIAPEMNGREAQLHTFCVGPDNNLWMCCSPAGATAEKADIKGAVLVYNGEGKLLKEIGLSFVPQAINFAPSGALFVAGSGKVAKLNPEGSIEVEKDAPNIGNKEEMIAELKKAAEAQVEQMVASYTKQLKAVENQIAKFKEPAEDETEAQTKKRERRLRLLEQQKEQFEQNKESIKTSMATQVDESAMGRLLRSTGLAATDKDIFVSCPATKGYGYVIYRMNHQLEEPSPVVEDVGGCCGQLDIQTDGEHLLIAENTAFQVGFYDRDGKRLNGFGKRAGKDQEGFGSCCNPMNIRCCNGEILTAESSIGHIKRFSKEGEYLGFIGTASIGGGCKHVALGFDSSRNWHYMMNVDRSHVAVLIPKDQAPLETEEEKVSREAMEGIGRRLIGTWEIVPNKNAKKADDDASMDNYIAQQYAHLEFAGDGSLVASPTVTGKSGEEKSDIVGAVLATVAGAADQSERKWTALGATDGKLEMVMIEDSIRSYGATVEFIGDDQATFTWFYGSPKQLLGGSSTYKLLTKDACGQKCKEGETCDKDKEAAAKTENPEIK